ncbi:Tn3 family transposase [Streptomyces sp. NPDC059378]|uniref:Tn3 family transposase n=1 Tax=Streptomyces sp. NPDC059378 TaxID=3346815 RepID=UPI0036BF2197
MRLRSHPYQAPTSQPHGAPALVRLSCRLINRRRKIARQLNKGESIHSLRRQLHYAREGKITRRQPAQQNEQAWCLTVVTNAVICWQARSDVVMAWARCPVLGPTGRSARG